MTQKSRLQQTSRLRAEKSSYRSALRLAQRQSFGTFSQGLLPSGQGFVAQVQKIEHHLNKCSLEGPEEEPLARSDMANHKSHSRRDAHKEPLAIAGEPYWTSRVGTIVQELFSLNDPDD